MSLSQKMPDDTGQPTAATLRASRTWVAAQFALVAALVVVYFGVRGLTEGSPAAAYKHAADLRGVEQSLGINFEAAVQIPFLASASLTSLANAVYIYGHWPVIIIVLSWLVLRHRDVFRRLRDGMIASGAVGMVIYATYPVAPPRLADDALVDTVTEHSHAYRVLQPPAFVNQYAAMPSLHVGWDLLVGMAIITASSAILLRGIGYAMPVLMGIAVVATANHYILDVPAGAALALLGHSVAILLERRRAGVPRLATEPAGRSSSRAPGAPPTSLSGCTEP